MTISAGQITAFGRHIVTFVAGVATFAGAAHWMTPEQTQGVTTGLTQVSSGLTSLLTVAGPMLAAASGLWASWTASHQYQVTRLKEDISSGKVQGVQVIGTPTSK